MTYHIVNSSTPFLIQRLSELTKYCVLQHSKSYELSAAQFCVFAGTTRRTMDFIQQDNVDVQWVDEFNCRALVCSFNLSTQLLTTIDDTSLHLQRLQWELIFPAHTDEHILFASNQHFFEDSNFRILSKGFNDNIVDVLDRGIVDMSFATT